MYAVSGLAVNHIADWEPNQRTVTGQKTLSPWPTATDDLTLATMSARAVLDEPIDVLQETLYRDAETLEFEAQDTRFRVQLTERIVSWERDEDRFFVKTANWLHLNRGKAAWTYIADSYAVGLLVLAMSGMWMIPGSKGIRGRGWILVTLGAAVPIAYVCLS